LACARNFNTPTLTGTAPKRIDDVMHSAREKAERCADVFLLQKS